MSSDTGPPKKRPRDETEPADYLHTPVEHHPDFWFDDGNIILLTQNTAFRVHQSVLSRYSEIFRDMFSVPQPPTDDAEKLDNCPVVKVPDTKEDLENILPALYGEGHKYFGSGVKLPFSMVSAMLRLGSKYQFEHIRAEAIRRLEICFPPTLAAFHSGVSKVITHNAPSKEQASSPIKLVREDAISVVCLARTLELDALLPAAFYTCACLPFGPLLRGNAHGDRLSVEDLERCLQGRDVLRSLASKVYDFAAKSKPGPDCVKKGVCRSTSESLVRMALLRTESCSTALRDLGVVIETMPKSYVMCEAVFSESLPEPNCSNLTYEKRIRRANQIDHNGTTKKHHIVQQRYLRSLTLQLQMRKRAQRIYVRTHKGRDDDDKYGDDEREIMAIAEVGTKRENNVHSLQRRRRE